MALLPTGAGIRAQTAPPSGVPDPSWSTSDQGQFAGDIPPGSGRIRAPFVEPRIETTSTERPVAPGVTLRSFDRYGPDGYAGTPAWLQADSLTVDLTKGTTVDYLFPGRVAASEPISVQANRAGAVAAVNGDFFDINNSNAPLGTGIRSGMPIQSRDTTDPTWHGSVATVTPEGVGSIGEVFFEGTIVFPDASSTPLTGINKPTLPVDGIEAFTPLWGTYCRCRPARDTAHVTEVEVVGWNVTAIRPQASEGEVPAAGFILVGREAGADRLATLKVGDPLRIEYRSRTPEDTRIQAAVSGRQLLVIDGEVQRGSDANNIPPAPRTAVGFSRDGTTMFLLTADGRQPAFSDGLGLDELGQMMAELGAYNALNLDGGGSTTIVARTPGSRTALVENVPSDGRERNDPNGLALFAPEGSGMLHGLWVQTVLDPARASATSRIAPARTERVFPGFIRRLTASGYDETYGPAPSAPRWRSHSPARGVVGGDGVFHARAPGPVRVTASDGAAKGAIDLAVLQPLVRLSTSTGRIALASSGETTSFGVVGYDRAGNTAPLEPDEISLSYDRELVTVAPDEAGQLTVTANKPSGTTLVTLRAGSAGATLPVTVGLNEVPVEDFEDVSTWSFAGERASGEVTPAEGRQGKGLRLTYDFTTTTELRTAGAVPIPGIVIPGEPRILRLWVNANDNREWASIQTSDAGGQRLPSFRGGYLTGTGWRQLEFPVPAGTRYPITLFRYYSAETRATASYQGDIVIDELTALVPPPVEVPPAPEVEDPLIVQDGDVSSMAWRFAVLSDAQISARNPESDAVRNVRRTLREIRAQSPDLLLVDGDLVAEGSAADFELARRILDEELGGALPYAYVPGDHERSEDSLQTFGVAFGETQRVFDHRGTRFITFDTSGLSVRGSDWTQLRTLRTELAQAATDPSVGSVILVEHVPPRDPTPMPPRTGQLSDRKEALTIENWLAEFRRTSGKGAALIGAHAGTFHARRVDGVPQFVNGPSGGIASTQPTESGFTGWSLWGVNPVSAAQAVRVRANPWLDGPRWLAVEVRPHVDALELSAPAVVRVGSPATIGATAVQGTRRLPVAYPVTADWSGSPNLRIGDAAGLRPRHKAWLDPRTGQLTAFRPGQIQLAVTVNGQTSRATVRLEAQPAP